MRQLIIDPEFRDKIPPLSEDEFLKLEENIRADGEVREPLVVWHSTIIDGHHRWKIIQKYPDIPYKVKQMDFPDKWAAIVWMCRNQLGRRNITDEQKTILIGEAYRAQKLSQGGERGTARGDDGKFTAKDHNGLLRMPKSTAQKIADDFKVGEQTVKRAERFVNGLDAADKVAPGFKSSVVSGEIKAPKNLISEIRNIPEAEQKKVVEAVRRGDIEEAKAIIRPEPEPAEEEERATYDAEDFYMDISAAVRNLDFSLKQHLVLVHNDMLRTKEGMAAAKRALHEGTRVIEKYLNMMSEVEKNG